MKECPRCGSRLVGEVIGIAFGMDDRPHHVQFNCECGGTRGIRWAEAPPELKREAVAVEDRRRA